MRSAICLAGTRSTDDFAVFDRGFAISIRTPAQEVLQAIFAVIAGSVDCEKGDDYHTSLRTTDQQSLDAPGGG